MDVRIESSWRRVLEGEFEKPYFVQLVSFLKQEYKTQTIFPRGKDIFRTFDLSPFDKTRVVILGQDPYHNVGQAHGLCFSVPRGVVPPPSLKNIYKEIESDIGIQMPYNTGELTQWAEQGILLLNATLTVRAHQAGSHQKKGWEQFTDAVIHTLSTEREGVVFLLWGNYAISKKNLIDHHKHCVLTSPHPSPLSAHRGFFGSKHFSQTNDYLAAKGNTTIDWSIS